MHRRQYIDAARQHLATPKHFFGERAHRDRFEKLLLMGIILLLEGEEHIMDQNDEIAKVEADILAEEQAISDKFDSVNAQLTEANTKLTDANALIETLRADIANGNTTDTLAELNKVKAGLDAVAQHVGAAQAVVTPPVDTTDTGTSVIDQTGDTPVDNGEGSEVL